jgi:hypothetical protein
MSVKKSDRLTKPLVQRSSIDIASIAGLTRNRHFAGTVFTEQDFAAEQNYVRRKVRLHNLARQG